MIAVYSKRTLCSTVVQAVTISHCSAQFLLINAIQFNLIFVDTFEFPSGQIAAVWPNTGHMAIKEF